MIQFFKRSVMGKLILLLLLSQMLGIALYMVDGVNEARSASRAEAVGELQSTYAGPQTLTGPVLVVPYVERWSETQRDASGKATGQQDRAKQMIHLVFPDRLDIQGNLAPQARYRGIFSVPFYTWNANVEGGFPAFDRTAVSGTENQSTLEFQAPYIAFHVSDVRGLDGSPRIDVGGTSLSFEQRLPGLPANTAFAGGLHASLTGSALDAWRERRPMRFKLQFGLIGQERLSMVPIGDETTAHLSSPWPHPSFGGRFLATERRVDARGFDATWRVSSLVTSARSDVRTAMLGTDNLAAGSTRPLQSFDVSLVEPINPYVMSARATKYGLLFIVLVLMAGFMFELFRKLPLHPVQYVLVGLSIALFFLLLLALSEKLAFGVAYAGAAGASVLLLSAYFSAVLRGIGRGMSFGAYVAMLYAALYVLLASESNALLLGAVLVFGMLAVLMLGTRHVDWYALGTRDGDVEDEGRAAPVIAKPATAR